ncbi:MAG: Lipoprotein signal peptidase [Candidatus Izimaplasma bacterium HR2]|nr:MAG: Lipoprotein signal peptidase [Candidatus Izimaplasma bacterium HR2]
MKKKHYIILASVTLIVILDQITKQLIANTMNQFESIEVIKDFFYISSHRNDGGAWGILGGEMFIFFLITALAFGLFYYLIKEADFDNKKLYSFSIVLLIAGAIGNFIDRLLFGYVVDFLDFYIFGYDFPTFNVADIALVVGVTIFAFDILKEDLINARNKNRSRK